MKLIIALLCGLLLAGCSSVLIKEPFPETPLTATEQEELAGVWQADEEVIHIAFSVDGRAWYAAVDWKEDDFHLEKERLYFSKHNQQIYVCMPNDPGTTNGYYFAACSQDGNKAFVWAPDAAVFAQLVEEGTLAGRVEKGRHSTSVRLDSPAADVLELISTNPAAINYKEPVLLQKLH